MAETSTPVASSRSPISSGELSASPRGEELPASCGAVGAEAFRDALPEVPKPVAPQHRGPVLTVTTSEDKIVGDTTSVAALVAHPGPDGRISLREAIAAINNDVGPRTLTFAPTLKDSVLELQLGELPPVSAAETTFDGDIDGSGSPGVTIHRAASSGEFIAGLRIQASGVWVHAIAFDGFSVSVEVIPRPGVQVYERIRVTSVRSTNAQRAGVRIFTGGGGGARARDSRYVFRDITFAGNAIDTPGNGIIFQDYLTMGDRISDVVLAHNSVRFGSVAADAIKTPVGIKVDIGYGLRAVDNVLERLTIANNTVEARRSWVSIQVNSGSNGAAGNRVSDVRVSGNRLAGRGFLSVSTGDGGSLDPPTFAEANVLEKVSVTGNVLQDQLIDVVAGLEGAKRNVIRDLEIAGNRLDLSGPIARATDHHVSIQLSGGGNAVGFAEPTSGNSISDVRIRMNSIREPATASAPRPTIRPNGDVYELGLAGIAIFGGRAGSGNSVSSLRVQNNQIDTAVVGVSIVGGDGHVFAGSTSVADSNAVTQAQIACNAIASAPSLLANLQPGVRGLNVVGGTFAAHGNRVDLTAKDNLVAGRLDQLSSANDIQPSASGNAVSVRGAD